tara:strand:+ start:429 stop:1292 length:864 start_codon:yes stop_codon:yes gene_type:complete
MARIGDLGNLAEERSSTAGTQQFSDSKSLWRNHIRPQFNDEFAVIRFVPGQDLEDGDKTLFHPVQGVSQNGRQFTSYEFCNDAKANYKILEKDERGVGIKTEPFFSDPCSHCQNNDPKLRDENGKIILRNRYRYYVMHYGTYHVESNPAIAEQREWTQDWKSVEVGRQMYYRETKMQIQILELAPGTWGDLHDDYIRNGTILGRTYEYRRVFRENQVRYKLISSDIKVPSFQKELEEAVSSLPPMTDISTGALTEIDLPVFQTAKKEKEQVVNDDAFANMANFEDEE